MGAYLYFTKYKKRMNGFSPAFYDGTHMLFQAMAAAGTTTDTDKVRVALENIKDFKGMLGTLNWTGNEVYGAAHQISAPFYIARVQDGQEVIEATCSLTECK